MDDSDSWEHNKSAIVVVAHPDDEVLWAGGTILGHGDWECFVAALCRGSDPDRAPRFRRALQALNASGAIGDLDDGPEQISLSNGEVRSHLFPLLPRRQFDIILTHGPCGEYTRHRRHEEVSRTVGDLWLEGALDAKELWLFAYSDAKGSHLPLANPNADIRWGLAEETWQAKHAIVTGIYGFAPNSFEARTTPREEAFWRFRRREAYKDWREELERER